MIYELKKPNKQSMFRRLSTLMEPVKKEKIVVILGSTATGKSDLSIQLATHFNGEIINSDSMQLYKNVDIVTNKHPIEERNNIPHHLMDFLPLSESYNLSLFEKDCNQKIKELLGNSKLPIIVGGTHYYLQALFNKTISEEYSRDLWTEKERNFLKENQFNTQVLYDELTKVDPVIASKWHPNDQTKLYNMLKIYYSTKEKPSDIYLSQEFSMKYDVLFLWVYSKPEILNKRLDNRVDGMFDKGALEEVKYLYEKFKEYNIGENREEKMKSGIWQVIGFKEFLPWLEDDCQDQKKFDQGKEVMKIKTRQYAKSQIKWIKNTLVPDIKGKNLFVLNASDLNEWKGKVENRAIDITQNFLKDLDIDKFEQTPEELSDLLDKTKLEKFQSVKNPIELKLNLAPFTCDNCTDKKGKPLVIIGQEKFKEHLNSNKHKHVLQYIAKKRKFEEWKKQQEEKEKEEGNVDI